MKLLIGVCVAISVVFGFAWLIGGGLQPGAFVIVAVPWLFVALHGIASGPPKFCSDPYERASNPMCKNVKG